MKETPTQLFNGPQGSLFILGIAGWVEEVQELSRQLGASFHHILKEANSMADGLAREGVSKLPVLFDV